MSEDQWSPLQPYRDAGFKQEAAPGITAREVESRVLKERWGESANVTLDQIRQAASVKPEGPYDRERLQLHYDGMTVERSQLGRPLNEQAAGIGEIGALADRDFDSVARPRHYVAPNGMEAIDVIEAFGLGFHLGNALKYLLRAGKKGDRKQDLAKAIWYLQRELNRPEVIR